MKVSAGFSSPRDIIGFVTHRLVHVDGECWYAPKCRECDKPATSIHRWHDGLSRYFVCSGCMLHNDLWSRDVYALREPQRLNDRMAEVMSGRGW